MHSGCAVICAVQEVVLVLQCMCKSLLLHREVVITNGCIQGTWWVRGGGGGRGNGTLGVLWSAHSRDVVLVVRCSACAGRCCCTEQCKDTYTCIAMHT